MPPRPDEAAPASAGAVATGVVSPGVVTPGVTPGALPTWQRQLPLSAVLVVAGVGLAVMAAVSGATGYRVGLCVVAAGLLAGAVMRGLLPARRIGLLAVRSRPFDVLAMLGCAAGIVVLALSLPPAS